MLYGYYLVALLDLMGQRESIRKMRVPMTDGEEAKREVLAYLKETAGKVATVRDMVLETVRAIGKPSHIRKELPLDVQAVMDRITEPRIRVMRFSDTIVLFMPMAGESGANTAVNVYGMLAAVAFALVTSFAGGVPLRGGIDIGAGINIEKDEVYGAALERAYALENTFADYPRVLVGHELLNYLTMLSGSHPQCSEDQLAKTFGRLALDLIVADDDGLPVLDYLCPQILEYSRNAKISPAEMFSQGQDFAVGEHKRFLAKGNLRLASRYGRLKAFYDRHSHMWLCKAS